MDTRWRPLDTGISDQSMLVGPGPAELPSQFETNLEAFDDPSLLMRLDLRFDGTRVVLQQLGLGSTTEPPRAITPADVARLRVAEAVRTSCVFTAQFMTTFKSGRWKAATTGVDPRPRVDRKASDTELRLVAAVYSFEYAAWGEPRNAVMNCWGLPRSTANGWIRRAALLVGGLPGVGTDHGKH